MTQTKSLSELRELAVIYRLTMMERHAGVYSPAGNPCENPDYDRHLSVQALKEYIAALGIRPEDEDFGERLLVANLEIKRLAEERFDAIYK